MTEARAVEKTKKIKLSCREAEVTVHGLRLGGLFRLMEAINDSAATMPAWDVAQLLLSGEGAKEQSEADVRRMVSWCLSQVKVAPVFIQAFTDLESHADIESLSLIDLLLLGRAILEVIDLDELVRVAADFFKALMGLINGAGKKAAEVFPAPKPTTSSGTTTGS